MDKDNITRGGIEAEALNGLLAAVSHEMNAIIELSKKQLRKSDLPAEYDIVFGKINSSAGNLLEMANNILGLPKTGTDSPELTSGECGPAGDAPRGTVLVVDDLEANRYVAEGMMQPYMVSIELAESGFEAIDLVKNGKVYDIIFMDHMMPEMDGVETTKKLRELGYNGAVVALTANVIAGSEKMFYENGFDGFIAKPIETDRLDHYMDKFISGRRPEEAGKPGKEAAGANADGSRPIAPHTGKKTGGAGAGFPGAVPGILEVFRRDAIKAITGLRKAVESGDTKHYTTIVHAMKSALAYIGELDASQSAFMLEKAGMNDNMEYINANTENFIKTLKELAKAIPEHAARTGEEDDPNIVEDKAFLNGQLRITQFACEDYDAEMAYEALDQLKGKTWKKETEETIKAVREMIYLHSDFEAVADICEKMAM